MWLKYFGYMRRIREITLTYQDESLGNLTSVVAALSS